MSSFGKGAGDVWRVDARAKWPARSLIREGWLLHSHFIRSREFTALRERIGPLIANLRVHGNRSGHALDRAIGLPLFDRRLSRIRLATIYAVDSFGAISFRAAGHKGRALRDMADGFVFHRCRVAAVRRLNRPVQDFAWINDHRLFQWQ